MIAKENKLWRNKLIIKTVKSIWKMLDMWNKILENAELIMSLSFESVNDIKWCDCLMLNMFSVCYSVTKDILKKNLKNTVSLIIDYSRNMLNIITTHETMNSKLDDACNVVSKNLAIMLNITLNNVHNVVLKNFTVMLSITFDDAYNVVLKNLAVMLSITLNDAYNVVLKNLVITLSIIFFKTFVIFAIC